MQSEFTIVGSFRTAFEAYAAKNYLEASGIRAFVVDEHTLAEGWWNDTEAKVRVAAADSERATELLAVAKNNFPG